MLRHLHLKNVRPAPAMDLDLAPRLNLLTGDNGLGKSFLLDIAWWVLTESWPADVNPALTVGRMVRPAGPGRAVIAGRLDLEGRERDFFREFDPLLQGWGDTPSSSARRGLVVYAQPDGSFAVWDPARNYWLDHGGSDGRPRPRAYAFAPSQIWDGLKGEKGVLCNGLIADWAGWQKEKGTAFARLRSVLAALSPGANEPLSPGELTRISVDDVRDIPTVRMAYQQDVPLLYAAAGVRRIAALAYLLVWTWEEHLRASHLLGQEPTRELIFLVDELEAHLHPRWQRTLLRALLTAVAELSPELPVQLLVTTHSPLVMASAEPWFASEQDAWFDLDLTSAVGESPQVRLQQRPWVRQGDATSWLLSEAFDLKGAGAIEREQALEEAALALSDEQFGAEQARILHERLRSVLPDTDPFWMRWRYVGEKRGWLP